MKLGVVSGFDGNSDPQQAIDAGRIAEERGFHSFFVPEHVLFFREYASRYPYSKTGRVPGDPEGVLEPFTALTWLAAHTTRIRLGTGICLVPQRSPVYTAKQAADVDYLSRGRLELGVGIGWLREEFAALGVPWERRAARTRECIGVMQALWCQEESSFEGEFYSISPCLLNPKPVQRPHPPIFFGGESDAALRRVAELGQGWYGYNVAPDQLTERLAKLDSLLTEAGRTRNELQIYIAPRVRAERPEDLAPYWDAGVDQLLFPLFGRDADGLARRADAIAKLV